MESKPEHNAQERKDKKSKRNPGSERGNTRDEGRNTKIDEGNMGDASTI
jgi:hypothetical protein